MSTWLDFIKIELDNLDLEQIHKPAGEVGSSDHEVGEADEELKRLYGLWMQLARTADEARVAMRYAQTQAELDVYAVTAFELITKAEIVRDIFWASVRSQFDLWDKSSVGVRREWKIVWSEEETPQIISILRQILEE